MAKIRYVKDREGAIVFPVTHERAVKDSNGVLLETKLANKQQTLVSGVNIKTIRGNSLLGAGNIVINDGASVLFYSGSFYTGDIHNNEVVTVFDPDASRYVLYVTEENFNGLTPQQWDLVLFFFGTILYITQYRGDDVTIDDESYIFCVPITKVDLRGATGATGPIGPAGILSANATIVESDDEPSVLVSVANQVLTLVFSGLKGSQGNSGYQGAANELEVVNNFTDGGAQAALSAEMGKQLYGMIPKLVTLTEAAYDLLVENELVDPDTYYFIYED